MAVDLEKFLRFSRKIEGFVRNLPIFAIAALGETQCIFRVMVGDVPLERGCGFITAAFCLNGNDLRSVLQNKINFAVLVGIIVRFDFKLPVQLLQDIVLVSSRNSDSSSSRYPASVELKKYLAFHLCHPSKRKGEARLCSMVNATTPCFVIKKVVQ